MVETVEPGGSKYLTKLRSHLLHRAYLAGYSGYIAPRLLRKLVAGSAWHRAWLLGLTGCFMEDKVAFGPARPYPDRPPEI